MNDELSPTIGDLVHKLPARLTPIERVLLANPGPVQSLLSVIYNSPVEVNPLSQCKHGIFGENTVRWIEMHTEGTPATRTPIALAQSVISNNADANPPEFIQLIEGQKLGIGQIIKKLNLSTHREVMGFYANTTVIARNYRIYGDCNILITETFFRDSLKKIAADVPPDFKKMAATSRLGPLEIRGLYYKGD